MKKSAMIGQIREITIKDYKGIHELCLSNLNQINILTGKNNSGKTSILELLATILSPGKLSSWLYGLRINSSPYLGYYRYNSYYEGFVNLFPCNKDEKHVHYVFIDDTGQSHDVQMTGKIFPDQLPESELSKINGFRTVKKEREEFIDVNGIELAIKQDGKELHKEVIYDKQRRLPPKSNDRAKNVVYISPVEHDGYNKYLNEMFLNTRYYELLIKMLSFFDDGLIGINAVKSDEDTGVINHGWICFETRR